ncbi:hypothetical protein [Flavobacterium cerinum]|uniref:Uncharacterized protein n=1 Tax=Flavobacterium cerinum TaxID=2502784 RepID=A0ABY5IRY6_9FLAO|nr:hypothetical protein [Flavobacterium cerinum]UUC45578.1 hypothetical protein NOX80_18400 [Flavobacterium cerinum]
MTKEEVIYFNIPAGQTFDAFRQVLPEGTMLGTVIFHNDRDNNYIQAAIKNDAGVEISKMQHIANYRSRNANYEQGMKPIPMNPFGKTYTLEIKLAEALATDFVGQAIFIYKQNECY